MIRTPAHKQTSKRKPTLREILDDREFYELMQQYRHAPFVPLQPVVDAFEAVKRFVVEKAIGIALREAIAAPQAEPVAWMSQGGTAVSQSIVDDMDDEERCLYPIPLYAAPVVREPLTQDQIISLAENYEERYHRWVFICVDELEQFARAIEKAHGIGGGGK